MVPVSARPRSTTACFADGLLTDARSALRALRHAPGFTAVAIATLGGGMALCVVLLTIANAYVLAPLPYPAADRLYSVHYAAPGEDHPDGLEALPWTTVSDVVEERIAWDLDVFTLRGGARPESAPGAWVTPGFMTALGIRAAIGHGFSPQDFEAGRPQVALISHRLWVRRFGGDPRIVGRQFEAYVSDRPDEAETFTIAGVLPDGLWHVNTYTDVIAPLRGASYPYQVRLRPGVSPTLAADRIARLARAGGVTLPATWPLRLISTQESYTARVRPMLRAVGVAAALVLLMACANVAVLQLLRAHRRQRELAVRLALGSSPSRLARLVSFEALFIGLGASALALVLSIGIVQPIVPLVERQVGRSVPGGVTAVRFDARVLAIAAGFGLLTAALCALAPLIVSRRAQASAVLAGSGRTATEGAGPRRARAVLVAIEVAASLALLSGSVLMFRSVSRMLDVDVGFSAERVYTAGLGLRQRSYPDAASRARFYERLLPLLQQTPGVSSVAIVDWWPLQPTRPRRVEAGDTVAMAGSVGVTADYFETLRIPLEDGRTFTTRDRLGTEAVAIVSETLARKLWKDERATGQRLRLVGQGTAGGPEASPDLVLTVVGVVGDVRHGVADRELADLYRPLLQKPDRFGYVHAKVGPGAAGWESAFARAVSSIDPDLPLGATRPLQEALDLERARPGFLASLLAAFAIPAALIALIGLHAAMAYSVRQREREIAIRLALGGDGRSIVRLFLGHGGVTLGAGLVAGLLAAGAMGRLLQSELFDVRPAEPLLLATTALALAGCGLAAIWLPARRAARTDPATALRGE
jgi:putative ABC transport system permease protein